MTIGQVIQHQDTNTRIDFHSSLADILQDFEGDEFALFFENCEPGGIVSFDIRTSLYNVGKDGNKDYLPIGEDLLPSLYMVSLNCAFPMEILFHSSVLYQFFLLKQKAFAIFRERFLKNYITI